MYYLRTRAPTFPVPYGLAGSFRPRKIKDNNAKDDTKDDIDVGVWSDFIYSRCKRADGWEARRGACVQDACREEEVLRELRIEGSTVRTYEAILADSRIKEAVDGGLQIIRARRMPWQ